MKDTMQSALQPPDLSVWVRTYLPTTSSRIKALLNGRSEAISCVLRPSEDGDMEFLEKNSFAVHPALIESSSSPSEGSWSSWLDTLTLSQETLCPYSISVLMASPQSLVLPDEEMDDESPSVEWPPIQSTSDTSPRRTVSGSLHRITSWIVSTIRRTGN
nr:MAG TPA: hypothetical protein [Caudoviricetes sp.]